MWPDPEATLIGRRVRFSERSCRAGLPDVLGNLAVLLAALGVFGTGTGWPDIIVAAIMAGLALQGATTVVRQSLAELRQPVVIPAE
jgi:Co/Zn/Cd efflux system component